MTRAKATLDSLPLFASDREIAEAVVGRDIEKVERLLSSLPRLEAAGFPRPTPGYGRYVPAVKDFYDRVHRQGGTPVVAHQEKVEGPWKIPRQARQRRA